MFYELVSWTIRSEKLIRAISKRRIKLEETGHGLGLFFVCLFFRCLKIQPTFPDGSGIVPNRFFWQLLSIGIAQQCLFCRNSSYDLPSFFSLVVGRWPSFQDSTRRLKISQIMDKFVKLFVIY